MLNSKKIDAIATAMAKAQSEMHNATLNKVNPHFKSRYADLAAIRDAIVPVLAKNDIAVLQPTEYVDGQLFVVTTLVHKSGQYMRGMFPVAGGANATAQQTGSATTYARRYSLAAMVGIAAEEDDDGNAAETAPKREQNPKPKTDPFNAFFAKSSYAFTKPNAGEWTKAFGSAVEHTPSIAALTKLEADNKDHINALDESLYAEISRFMQNRMAYFGQMPVAAE